MYFLARVISRKSNHLVVGEWIALAGTFVRKIELPAPVEGCLGGPKGEAVAPVNSVRVPGKVSTVMCELILVKLVLVLL